MHILLPDVTCSHRHNFNFTKEHAELEPRNDHTIAFNVFSSEQLQFHYSVDQPSIDNKLITGRSNPCVCSFDLTSKREAKHGIASFAQTLGRGGPKSANDSRYFRDS
ncbi:hypothetical protein ABW19_dt0210182 [Dactylella cylindrospora]|nr:hypothetical protein ABW19_dt0210182 [Dactylella cylindrospora]